MFSSPHPFYLVFSLPLLGCRMWADPAHRERRRRRAVPSLREALPSLRSWGMGGLKSQSSHHLSPDPPSTLMNLCKWTEQKKTGRDLCHHIRDLTSGPKHNFISVCAQKLKTLLPLVHQFQSLARDLGNVSVFSPREVWECGHLGTQRMCNLLEGVLFGSRNRHSSTVSCPTYFFHFEETKNQGN